MRPGRCTFADSVDTGLPRVVDSQEKLMRASSMATYPSGKRWRQMG